MARTAALFSTLSLLLPILSPHIAVATPLVSPDSLPGQALLHTNQDAYQYQGDGDTDAIYASDDVETTAPSWFTSTLMARRLLALASTGVASTIFPADPASNSHAPPSVAGHSVSLPEYVADCDRFLPGSDAEDSGNPTFLGLRVSTTFRNIAAGSNVSLSLDWWDHVDSTSPLFPGFPRSEAGLPRVTLFGHIEELPTPVPAATEKALRKCYTERHPDAKVWLPGRPGSPHASFWARMVVDQVYWIGGFGGFQRIGWMSVDDWKGVREDRSLPGVGDGRGWRDVRLPGEK